MKRPLVLVGFCYLLTLAAAVSFGAWWSLLLACCCLFGSFITLIFPKTRATGVFPLALLTISLAFGSFAACYQSSVEPTLALNEKDAVIDGTVCELPYQAYNRFYYVIEVNNISIPNAPEMLKIRLSSQGALNVEPYSHIKGKVHLFLPSGGEGYSSRSYYASKGITIFAFLYEYDGVKITPPTQKPVYYYALQLRSALLKSVRSMLPPQEAKLINGVLFGDQTSLSPEVASDFRTIGISHILSVSGLHMATMAELLLLLLLFFRVPKKIAALVAAVGVLCFMAITCFVPSVTRSGVMCLLYLFGILLSRRPDALNSLGAAVFLISLTNPYAAADVGLLLSFFATLGLILVSGKVSCYLDQKYDKIKRIRPLVRGVNGILATTVSAVLFTLPIIIVSFGSVSLVAPVSNLLELVPSTLMMNFAAVAAVLNLIAPQSFLAMPFALVAGLLAKYMQACAHWLAQIPYASISASYGFVLIWLSGSLLLAAVTLLLMKKRRLLKATAWLSIILLLTGIFSFQISMHNVTRLAVLDVGSAESVVLTRNGHAAVVGCGGFSSNPISAYLRSQGIIQLDYIQTLTQTREESVNCAELIDAFHPKRLVMQNAGYVDGFLQEVLPEVSAVTSFHDSAISNLWDNANLRTQSVGTVSAAHVTINQVTVFVCPDEADLSALPEEWFRSDFLVSDSLPKTTVPLEPFYTVLSMDEDDLRKTVPISQRLNPIATGGNGDIVLEFKNDRTLQLRRE
jgi:competence protein ComEC